MLTTNQMYSTKSANVNNNYYGLLSIDDDDDQDDITIITSNKTTSSSALPEHIPTQINTESMLIRPSLIRTTAINLPTKAKAWRHIIHDNSLTQLPQASMALNTKRIVRAVKWAISDSGATGHFMVEGAPVINKQPAQHPIKILMPDGSKLCSTHTCN